jgi:hypothetical protein
MDAIPSEIQLPLVVAVSFILNNDI